MRKLEYNYSEVYTNLCFQAAVVSFFKKDGSIRTMLCTRDVSIVGIACGDVNTGLQGHDKRCNKDNNNIAVVDLILGEARSFNIERVMHIEYINTPIKTRDDFDKAVKTFSDIKAFYERSINGNELFDNVDTAKTVENTEGNKNAGQLEISNAFSVSEMTPDSVGVPDIDVNALFAQ